MARSAFEDLFGSILGLIVIGLLLLLALIITPLFLIGVVVYVVFRLYRDSSVRMERLARNETMLLYNHALAGQVTFTDDEIETALSRTWPLETPEPVRIQLLEIGRALYADEGLSPEVPPPPAICNTVEGARYRDQLARLGQARGDRVMAISC